jgi:hypothetical protein
MVCGGVARTAAVTVTMAQPRFCFKFIFLIRTYEAQLDEVWSYGVIFLGWSTQRGSWDWEETIASALFILDPYSRSFAVAHVCVSLGVVGHVW